MKENHRYPTSFRLYILHRWWGRTTGILPAISNWLVKENHRNYTSYISWLVKRTSGIYHLPASGWWWRTTVFCQLPAKYPGWWREHWYPTSYQLPAKYRGWWGQPLVSQATSYQLNILAGEEKNWYNWLPAIGWWRRTTGILPASSYWLLNHR